MSLSDVTSRSEILAFHDSGVPAMMVISADTDVRGVPCRAGPVVLHENGLVAQAALSKPWALGHCIFEPGDLVILRADGSLEGVWLAKRRPFADDTPIDAAFFGTDGYIDEVIVGERGFDSEGRLRSRRLSSPETIDGIPCSNTERVRFHASGKLEHAELGGPFASPHGLLPKGTLVNFDENGRLTGAFLREAAALSGKEFPANSAVSFVGAGGPTRDTRWKFYTPDPPGRR